MRDLRSQNNDIEVAIKMKAELQEKINLFYKKEFSEYLLKMDIFGNTQKLKKTLRMLEIILRQNANISELSQYSKLYIKGGVDIDHIHPKNSADENAEYTNMIGNAALLKALINRSLQDKPFEESYTKEIQQKAAAFYGISSSESQHLVFTNKIDNKAYNPKKDKINLLYKDGRIVDIAEAADQLNISVLAKTVTKHFLCYPKECVQ